MAWYFQFRRIGKAQIRLNSEIFLDTINEYVKNFADDNIIPKLKEGVQTWSPEHQPQFEYQVDTMIGGPLGSGIVFTFGCDFDKFPIYHYINEGTDVRWAVMSNDWVSKTQPGRIWAGPGEGSVVAAGRSAMRKMGYIHPMAGIEPRDFGYFVRKASEKEWRNAMRNAVRNGRIRMERYSRGKSS